MTRKSQEESGGIAREVGNAEERVTELASVRTNYSQLKAHMFCDVAASCSTQPLLCFLGAEAGGSN